MGKTNHDVLEHSILWNTSRPHDSHSSTLCSHQIQRFGEHDSSSTQSTGQSKEAGCLSASNAHLQFISSDTGHRDSNGMDNDIKSILSLGTPEFRCSTLKTDNGQSIVCPPFSSSDPYLSGIIASYGQHSVIYPQTTRVPLPLEMTEDGPIYVNAKQFHAILRRRQLRAKLEAQNKAAKGRKPYLHESRHVHAMKRVRGSDGRFVNTKLLQLRRERPKQSKSDTTSIPCSSLSQLDYGRDNLLHSFNLCLKNRNMSTSDHSSASEATVISSTNIFHPPEPLRCADLNSHLGGSMQPGVVTLCNIPQQQLAFNWEPFHMQCKLP